MKKENKTNKLRKITFAILALAMLILLSTIASAIQTPIGIDGYVYELDGLTQVQKNTDMKIVNLDTNEEIQLKTGFGLSGRYSIALDWGKGTNVQLIAYNSEHNSSRNTTLTGVIHNFNLLLNTTLPQAPPTFVTTNIEDIEQLKLFKKQIEAQDKNGDKITFELESAPVGMKMIKNTGLIYWVPKNNQQGTYEFTIVAKDDYGQTRKTFTVFVNKKQKSNQTNSTNETSITEKGNLQIQDELSFSKTSSSSSSSVNSNNVLKEEVTQVLKEGIKDTNTKLEKSFKFEDKPVNEILLKDKKSSKITVTEITKNTNKKIERIVYKYLEISPENENHDLEATIKFKVDKSWIKQKNLKPEDIELTRLHNGEWQELKTKPLYDDGKNIVLESQTPGFSLFAITHKKEVIPNNNDEQIVKIKTNNVVYGIIHSNKELSEDAKLEFIIENERLSANIQKISDKEYVYQINIPENINEIKYKFNKNGILKEGTIKITGAKTEVNIDFESNIFSTLKDSVSNLSDGKITEVVSMVLITILTAFILIFYILRKKEKDKEENIENE